MEKLEYERTKFNSTSIVTVYDSICVVATAWNLVPNSVICYILLSYRILAPYRQLIIQEIKKRKTNAIEKARSVASSSCFDSEKFIS